MGYNGRFVNSRFFPATCLSRAQNIYFEDILWKKRPFPKSKTKQGEKLIMVLLLIKVVVLLVAINSSFGLQLNNWNHSGSASAPCQNMLPASQDEITRRGLFGATAAAITTTLLSPAVSFPALAFDGSGASASAGYRCATTLYALC